MARSLLASAYSAATSAGSTVLFVPIGVSTPGLATEADAQFKVAVPGVIDRLGINVRGTTGTTRRVVVRKNGADGINWAYGDGAAQFYLDSTGSAGSVSVVAGDAVCFSRYNASGSVNYTALMANFNSTGPAATFFNIGLTIGASFTTASASRNFGLGGHIGIYSDADVNARTEVGVTGTLRGGHIDVSVNGRSTDTVFTLHIDGTATAITITVPPGATGLREATGLTASITAGQRAHWRQTNGSGTGAFETLFLGVTLEATSGRKSDIVTRGATGVARAGSATANYTPIVGRMLLTSTTLADNIMELGFEADLSNLRFNTGTAGYDTTVTVVVNGTPSATLKKTQSSGASGWAAETGVTLRVAATDEIAFEITGGTSGSTTIHEIGLTIEEVTNPSAAITGGSTVVGTMAGTSAITGGSTAAATMAGTASITGGSSVSAVQFVPSIPATITGGSTVVATMAGRAAVTGGSAVAAVQYVPPPPIEGLVQGLTPSARIELFELDASILGGTIYRFHAGVNGLLQPVVWAGEEYSPFPVQATGFEYSGQGPLPRPKFRVANVAGVMSSLVMLYEDLAGCKVTRIRTMAKFLDAVNFPSGNPDADPEAEYPREIYYIDRKSSEGRDVVEFELSSSLDMAGVMFPSRQVVQNYCPWAYRGAECGYTGTDYFDTNDQVVAVLAQDVCGKRLSSCRKRFGQYGELPYGGFPAAGLLRM